MDHVDFERALVSFQRQTPPRASYGKRFAVSSYIRQQWAMSRFIASRSWFMAETHLPRIRPLKRFQTDALSRVLFVTKGYLSYAKALLGMLHLTRSVQSGTEMRC